MNNKVIGALIIVVLALGGYWVVTRDNNTTTGTAPELTMSVLTGGNIIFSYATSTYGLASSADAVATHPVNLPCDAGFGFCLYRLDTSKGDAGVSIVARTDLKTQSTCISTSPAGSTLAPQTSEESSHATSVFNLDANSSVYRLWDGNLCHEFVTRIQPASNVAAVAAAQIADATVDIDSMLSSVTIASTGAEVVFPEI
ncbi:MAG: hypothetical protein Q7R54_02230 [bacterium]|nr:hypothetical protein [bacterium]